MKKPICLLVFCIFSLTLPSFGSNVNASRYGYPLNTPSPPRLRYPITETVVLGSKDYLEFEWWSGFGLVDHYEFRLFKGYNMYVKDLIYKEIVPARVSSINIKAEVFEDNQVYTWSLIKVALGGLKSDKSFNSFKVFKTIKEK